MSCSKRRKKKTRSATRTRRLRETREYTYDGERPAKRDHHPLHPGRRSVAKEKKTESLDGEAETGEKEDRVNSTRFDRELQRPSERGKSCYSVPKRRCSDSELIGYTLEVAKRRMRDDELQENEEGMSFSEEEVRPRSRERGLRRKRVEEEEEEEDCSREAYRPRPRDISNSSEAHS